MCKSNSYKRKKLKGRIKMISGLKKAAVSSLTDKWGLAVLSSFLYHIISRVCMLIIGFPLLFLGILLSEIMNSSFSISGDEKLNAAGAFSYLLVFVVLFICLIGAQGIMNYGYLKVTLRLAKKESTTIGELFEGFRKSNVFKSIKVTTLMTVYTLLWSVLLIVPGIIKFISYSMAYYILLDHPEYTASEAIKKSQELMKGHKLDLFLLSLSFIGWFILGIIIGFFTFGIPFLWIYPYYITTVSHFYLKIVNRDTVMEEKKLTV